MLGQPVHERPVIGNAPQQRHGGVGVGVDQTGDQGVVRKRFFLRAGIAAPGLGDGQNRADAAVPDRDRVVVEHDTLRFDGNDPAGRKEQIGV